MDNREKFYRYFKKTLFAVIIPISSVLVITALILNGVLLSQIYTIDNTGENYTESSSSSYSSSSDSYTSKESNSSSYSSSSSHSSSSSYSSYSTYSSSSSFSYDPTSYLGLTLSTFSYREFTDMYGKPDEFVSNKAYYYDIPGYGSIALGYDGYNGNGYNAYSNNTVKFIEIYGGSNVEIANETYLGGTLEYYSSKFGSEVYDALEMGAGDHGASWYELPILYTSSTNHQYNVDYLFADPYSECYGARIEDLGELAYGM